MGKHMGGNKWNHLSERTEKSLKPEEDWKGENKCEEEGRE